MAVKTVAISTPLALRSLLILKKRKKAIIFNMAPNAIKRPRFPCSFVTVSAVLNVKFKYCDKIKTQIINPKVLAIIPTKKPIKTSFLII